MKPHSPAPHPVLAWIDATFEWLPNALSIVACIAVGAFALVYFTASNWRKTQAGQSLMGLAVALATLLLMNSVHLATGRYPGITITRILVYSALAAAGIRLVVTLVHILRKGHTITVGTFINRKEKRS